MKGGRLRAEKGINLPDTDLDIPALTGKDLADLKSVVRFADIIGLSFVRDPEDIFSLQDHLARLGAGRLGVVLKIETRRAFENCSFRFLSFEKWQECEELLRSSQSCSMFLVTKP